MTDEQYIASNFSMFGGPDDSDLQVRRTKVVVVRKTHKCACPGHKDAHSIPTGARAVRDVALMDDQWGSLHVCLPCLESWERHCESGQHYCVVAA